MTNAKERIRASAMRARQHSEETTAAAAALDPEPETRAQPSPARKVPAPEVKAPPRRSGGAQTPRLRPVRKNVDLSPVLNRRLGDWQRDAALDLGLARVTAQEVLTELIHELLDDPDLGERIKQRVHNSVDQ